MSFLHSETWWPLISLTVEARVPIKPCVSWPCFKYSLLPCTWTPGLLADPQTYWAGSTLRPLNEGFLHCYTPPPHCLPSLCLNITVSLKCALVNTAIYFPNSSSTPYFDVLFLFPIVPHLITYFNVHCLSPAECNLCHFYSLISLSLFPFEFKFPLFPQNLKHFWLLFL